MNRNKYIFVSVLALALLLTALLVVLVGNKASSPSAKGGESNSSQEIIQQDSSNLTQDVDELAQQSSGAKGSYVSLNDYQSNPEKYTNINKVYFFHASWCPICQGIDKELQNNPTKVPNGVTIIKTDFDKSTELRQKYGVTTQYTFVQVDANDAQVAKWTATSADKAIAGIKVN